MKLTPLEGRTPIPWVNYDLGALGYDQAEFVLDGTAVSYRRVGERTADGVWEVDEGPTAAYRTRFVVRRPVDASRFSGTVVVEWLNVSGGLDYGAGWSTMHREILRRGHVWVGVSAQLAGIEGGGVFASMPLKQADAERYASLVHPGDEWAYDIFTQVGKVLRGEAGAEPLRGLSPQRIVAIGQSQSAMFLSTYVNAVDPIAPVYDAFLVHSRGAMGASFDGTIVSMDGRGPDRIRDDVRVPVIVLETETDVVLMGWGNSEQADGPNLRVWEVAGAAHADIYLVGVCERDDGTLSAADFATAMRPTKEMLWGTLNTPANAAPQHHYVAHAALNALVSWAAGGPAPPRADRLLVAAGGMALETDEHGLARGGVRTPWVDVPVAVLSGSSQGGDMLGALFGTTIEFDDVTLKTLYPGGRDDYLERFTRSLDDTIAAGFLLADDRDEILAVAAAAWDLGPST